MYNFCMEQEEIKANLDYYKTLFTLFMAMSLSMFIGLYVTWDSLDYRSFFYFFTPLFALASGLTFFFGYHKYYKRLLKSIKKQKS